MWVADMRDARLVAAARTAKTLEVLETCLLLRPYDGLARCMRTCRPRGHSYAKICLLMASNAIDSGLQ